MSRIITRRCVLKGLAGSSLLFTSPGLFAEELAPTPLQPEGPFFPDKLPLDTDNDLLILNDSITPAIGRITHLTGEVLTPAGSPVRNALVEIFQVDAQGIYSNTSSPGNENFDSNFQGYGRFSTGRKGEFYFRTIQPVAYADRAPHVHLVVSRAGKRYLSTQFYVKGHERNERDGLLAMITDQKSRDSLILDYLPVEGSAFDELQTHCRVVLGVTPSDPPPRG